MVSAFLKPIPIGRCAAHLPLLFLISISIVISPALGAALATDAPSFPHKQAMREAPAPLSIAHGETIEKQLAGGHSHTYSFRVEAGAFAHITVDQLGIDVALTLFDPDGKSLGTMDSPNGDAGLEQISAIAATCGLFQLKIESPDKNVPEGRYRLTLAISASPTDSDRARIAAEKLLMEAMQLGHAGTPTSEQQGIQKMQDSLPFWQKAGDLYELALAQETLAPLFAAKEKQAEAANAYSAALELWHQQKNSFKESEVSRNFGLFYYYRGEMKRALELFERALPLDRADGNQMGEGETLSDLGEVYQDLGDKQKALAYFQQAEPLMMEHGTVDNQGAILNNLGGIYEDLDEKQKAVDYYLQALPKARQSGNRAGESTILQNIGRLYYMMGEARKALPYFDQSVPLAREAGDKRREAMSLTNEGAALEQLGEKQKAIEKYKTALELQRSVGDKPGIADSLNNLGVTYNTLGQPEQALEFFKQALPIQQEAGIKPKEGITLSNIAEIYFTKGDPGKAIEYYGQALNLLKLSHDHYSEGICLDGIGAAYDALGNLEKSLDFHKQALALFLEIGSRSGEANARDNLAFIWAKQGKLDDARTYSGQAALLYQEVDDPLEEGVALGNLMEENAQAGQYETAVFFGKQAIEKFQIIRRNIRGLEKQTQRSFVKKRENSYRHLAALLIRTGRLGEAQQVLDLLKDQEYFEFIRRDERESPVAATAPLTKKEDVAGKQYREHAAQITAVGNEWSALRRKTERTAEEDKRFAGLTDRLKLANQEWDQFLRSLYKDLHSTQQAAETVENLEEHSSGMQAQLQRLGPGVVALYTLVGDEKYQVILVTPQLKLAREYKISAQDLRQKVLDFRESLQDPRSNPLPRAKELYQILIGPVAADLAGAKAVTLMWSLDDVLRYLPLAALHDGTHYLLERYRNVEFTPASLARLEDRRGAYRWKGLGLGVSKAYEGFPALPAVPEELRRVIHEEGIVSTQGVLAGHVMLDDAFTEDALKKSLGKKYPLVHIASHFAFRPGNETDSFLLLGGSSPEGKHLTLAEIREDPAFSFTNTELITLSACDTAMGGSGSDGREVDGLGRLAQQKGAKAVIATLWAVEDQSTGVLMQNFYKIWTSKPGIPKAEALRQAQINLLRGSLTNNAPNSSPSSPAKKASWKHPYYWGPFILIGNWK